MFNAHSKIQSRYVPYNSVFSIAYPLLGCAHESAGSGSQPQTSQAVLLAYRFSICVFSDILCINPAFCNFICIKPSGLWFVYWLLLLIAANNIIASICLCSLRPVRSTEAFEDSGVDPLDPEGMLLRVLSLSDWGYGPQQTGPVSQLQWTPDGRAVAVGYLGQGLAVWSASGCRLMTTLPQMFDATDPGASGGNALAALQHQSSVKWGTQAARQGSNPPRLSLQGNGRDSALSPSAAHPSEPAGSEQQQQQAASSPLRHALECGVSCLCWGPEGYTLALAEVGFGTRFVELQYAKTLDNHHRVYGSASGPQAPAGPAGWLVPTSAQEIYFMLGHDRLLLINEPASLSNSASPSCMHPAASMDGGGFAGNAEAAEASSSGVDLIVQHVPVPQQYISLNWPIRHAAVSASGQDIAVSGARGLAIYRCVKTVRPWGY